MSGKVPFDEYMDNVQCGSAEAHPDHYWHVHGKRITSVTPDRLLRYCLGRKENLK